MTRFSAAILFGLSLGLCLGLCGSGAGWAQDLEPAAPAETSPAPPPLICPPNSHTEGGACIIDVAPPPAPPRALVTVACNDRPLNDGRCLCPAGFQMMPTGTDPVGTCVRLHADHCLGGQMTVTGECLCIGQVTMSGQVYDLEFAHGKCVPKRCPRDGPCAIAVSTPNGDTSPKMSSEGRRPARHRSHWADPNTYFRYPGPMNY